MTDDDDTEPGGTLATELAEVQARINELERRQLETRERIKELRSKELKLTRREGRTAEEPPQKTIRRAISGLDPDEPHGYPWGDVVETAVQMGPHHSEADIEDTLESMMRCGEAYQPVEGWVKLT